MPNLEEGFRALAVFLGVTSYLISALGCRGFGVQD